MIVNKSKFDYASEYLHPQKKLLLLLPLLLLLYLAMAQLMPVDRNFSHESGSQIFYVCLCGLLQQSPRYCCALPFYRNGPKECKREASSE